MGGVPSTGGGAVRGGAGTRQISEQDLGGGSSGVAVDGWVFNKPGRLLALLPWGE